VRGSQQSLGDVLAVNGNSGYDVELDGGNRTDSSSNSNKIYFGDLTDNAWNLISISVTSTTEGKIWLNGFPVQTKAGTSLPTGITDFILGTGRFNFGSSGGSFTGDVGSLRIFDSSWSDTLQVAVYAEGGPTIFISDVNDAPLFSTSPVNEVDAEEDAAYTRSLSDDVSDPDSGDTLTFSKISGPAWLTVASDGTLSGTPSNEDVGMNSWTINVTDNNGGSSYGVLRIFVQNVNDAPAFNNDPITGANAAAETSYLDTLAGSGADPDSVDVLTYAKIAGPSWLQISSDGSLSGTPLYTNLGVNTFTVRVSDGNSGTDTATLTITVINNNTAPVFTNLPG
jgi:hypothetical protein